MRNGRFSGTLKTVGELRKELEEFPADMPLIGYNGSDSPDVPISLILMSEEDRSEDEDKRAALMVSVEH